MFDVGRCLQVECRLSIGSKGLTNTKVNFQYFSVGDATKTVAFGPGLLHGTAPAVPVMFMIQARDKVISTLCCWKLCELCDTRTYKAEIIISGTTNYMALKHPVLI